MPSMNDTTGEDESLPVTFFPSLYLQRRIWILDVLRREGVTSVVDIGCGEGQLLVCLAQPALYLAPPDDTPDTQPPPSPSEISQDELYLHCAHIAGLDISSGDLQFAIEGTACPPEDGPDVRWEPLEVKIWQGGLEAFQPEFVDVECIVAMEVIEHLSADIFDDFAPIMLGVYRPRLLLVTTPSYTYNARFTPPGIRERAGWPDPTERTDRIFRHHDHKFEWTVEEFAQWCKVVADEWGYEVKPGAVGRAMEKDPWGRESELGGASQVAEFRRLDDEVSARKREENATSVLDRAKKRPAHELLATHQHPAHPLAQKPTSKSEIAEAVRAKMIELRDVLMRMEELWFHNSISVPCGGWIERLVEAVESDERFVSHKADRMRGNWRVEMKGDVPPDMEFWQPESVGEISFDALSETGAEMGETHCEDISDRDELTEIVTRGDWEGTEKSEVWGSDATESHDLWKENEGWVIEEDQRDAFLDAEETVESKDSQ